MLAPWHEIGMHMLIDMPDRANAVCAHPTLRMTAPARPPAARASAGMLHGPDGVAPTGFAGDDTPGVGSGQVLNKGVAALHAATRHLKVGGLLGRRVCEQALPACLMWGAVGTCDALLADSNDAASCSALCPAFYI